ncbi:MAG: cyclodeaminase/cyclohydrolase family protein, partial [Oscillospiraceae bacterium]
AQKDSESFDAVTAVFKMPKETEEDKLKRKAAMEEALKGCVIPPLEVMELSSDTLKQMLPAVRLLNQSALSDLGVAALSLKTALSGAYMNVLINLQGISDMDFKEKYFTKSEKMHLLGTRYAEEIYNGVLESLAEDVKKTLK